MLRRRLLSALTVIALMLNWAILAPPAASESHVFTKTSGFATKTGFRFVFAWEATQAVYPTVRFGTSPTTMTETAFPFPVGGVPDKSGMAIFDDLDRSLLHQTIYWQLTDDLTGELSSIKSFKAENAYSAWDPIAKAYTINLLVQLDSESLPPEIPHDQALADIAAGMNVFAERFYDATDKFIRIGEVLVTDTNLDYPVNIPFLPPDCDPGSTNAADVLIQTTVPFDSHTFAGWMIDDPCTSFYVGRLGQLVFEWQNDLHFGYVAAHEMAHYALNAPDLYPNNVNNSTGDCRNLAWDGSLMHNTGGWTDAGWELTELDRNASLTPCAHGTEPYTWDVMRQRYINIPLNPAGPIDHVFDTLARGNPDGDALQICILDRQQATASSTYTCIVPDDGEVPLCGNTLPQVVDPIGDSSGFVLEDVLLPPEPSLDILAGFLTWDAAAQAVTFHITVDDLTDLPMPTGGDGRFYRFYFTHDGKEFQLEVSQDALGESRVMSHQPPDAATRTTLLTNLGGDLDSAADEITVVLPLADFNSAINTFFNPDPPAAGAGTVWDNFEVIAQRQVGLITATADIGRGHCSYRIGQDLDVSNVPPIAVDDSASTEEDTPVIVSVLSNDSDPDGDTVSVTGVGTPTNGTATNIGNGTVTYNPNPNFNGADNFVYTIGDGRGGSDTAVVSVTVMPSYDPPQAFDDSASTNEGNPVTVNVLANDVGEGLDVTTATDPPNGTAVVNGNNTITYTPDASFVGTDSFDYTITDGTSTDSAQVVVTVRPAGSADPCVVPGLTILTDPSGDQLPGSGDAYDIRTISAAGLFVDDGTLVITQKQAGGFNPPPTSSSWRVNWKFGTPAVEYWVGMDTFDLITGVPTFSYGTVDATLGFVTRGTPDAGSFTPDGKITIKIAANKVGSPGPGSVLTNFVGRAQLFVGEGSTVGGVLLNLDGTTNASPPVALASFTLASCATAALNSPPSAIDDAASTNEDTPVNVNVVANDSDPDGDSLTVTQIGTPSNGTATDNGDGTVTYSPNPNFNGNDSFNYTISDGEFSSTAQVTVTVAPANDGPDANNDNGSTDEDTAVTVDVLANDTDTDGGTLTVTAASDPANGRVVVNSDSIDYIPDTNFHGNDSFTYTISDGQGGSDTAVVSMIVHSVNDPPDAANDSATVRKNRSGTINVLANDSDPDGDTLSVVSAAQPSKGSVAVNADGSITYTPRKGFVGTDSFTYTISDGNGGEDTATVTVTVPES